MKPTKLVYRLFAGYLLILLAALSLDAWISSQVVRREYISDRTRELQVRTQLVKEAARNFFLNGDSESLDSLAKKYGALSGTRFTFIAVDGKVLGDSEADKTKMENHGDRPEVIQALSNGMGISIRPSPTLDTSMLYVSTAVETADGAAGVVRAAVPLGEITLTVREIYRGIFLSGILIAVIAGIVSMLVAVKFTRPINDLRQGAERFARGDLQHRIRLPHIDETAGLAVALNSMAQHLSDRIDFVTRQSNEVAAIISSMSEGLIVIDQDDHIVRVNRAFADLLGGSPDAYIDRTLEEAVRVSGLLELAEKAKSSPSTVNGEIIIPGRELHLLVHAGRITGTDGGLIGTLMVLSDISDLRRLETMRSEFIANVSHELKTPLTAIIGYLESAQLIHNAPASQLGDFLSVAVKHAHRLNDIVSDLLTLATLEEPSADRRLNISSFETGFFLDEILATFSQTIEAQQRRVFLGPVEVEQLTADRGLILTAAEILISNALQHTPTNAAVEIGVRQERGMSVLFVRDEGQGIAPEHQVRLFERFYRVDSDRSRNTGGSGLGLAIVKHIAALHQGSATVKSRVGEGSEFCIHLPRRQENN